MVHLWLPLWVPWWHFPYYDIMNAKEIIWLFSPYFSDLFSVPTMDAVLWRILVNIVTLFKDSREHHHNVHIRYFQVFMVCFFGCKMVFCLWSWCLDTMVLLRLLHQIYVSKRSLLRFIELLHFESFDRACTQK